jgi:branched-chain amino acid transport system permease protein
MTTMSKNHNAVPVSNWMAGAIVLAIIFIGIFVPNVVKSTFYLSLFINSIVLGIAAVSIGFLAHQCGLIMFGAAGFTGGATYLFGIAVMHFKWDVTTAAVFCLMASTLICLLIGAIVVRARPLPFAMMTLALAQMLRSVVRITAYRDVTGGDDGLTMSWNGTFLGLTQSELARPANFWVIAWLSLCTVMLMAWWVGQSQTGEILRATKANEERMRFSGFNTYIPRVLAFALSGFIAAVSGLLMGLHTAFASPELLDFATGANSLVSMLIGGAGAASGPVLGALLYTVGQDQFGASGHLELLTGLGVVVVVVAFPSGTIGFLQSGFRRITRRQDATN